MGKILCFIVVVVALVTGAVYAGEPTADLDPKVAVRLIGMKVNLNADRIDVAYIVDGSVKEKDGFEAKHVRRVAAIMPVSEGGALVRRVVYFDIYWNEALGWFLWETRAERGGDAVYRWSERGGETVVK